MILPVTLVDSISFWPNLVFNGPFHKFLVQLDLKIIDFNGPLN